MHRPVLAVTSYTAVSAIGAGRAQTLRSLHQETSGLRQFSLPGERETHLGSIDGLDDIRLPAAHAHYDCANARLAEMGLMADGFAETVFAARDRYGASRVAVVIGSSTSGVSEGEHAYRELDADDRLPDEFDFAHTQELYAVASYVRERLGLEGLAYTISTACTSSTKSFVDAANLIHTGLADAVVVGGVDTLCDTSVHGFLSLELLSPTPCRPNDVDSCGISIGEAAGFALIERVDAYDEVRAGGIRFVGAGESSDAHHMSSPHPEGTGAIMAMRAALRDAGLDAQDIDYVNLHGTGSLANDRVEALAVSAVLGTEVAVSSTKGWTGHTLGAAGIVDSVLTMLALDHGIVLKNLNMVKKNPAFATNIVGQTFERSLRYVMTNNFAFGGNNCTLIFGRAG